MRTLWQGTATVAACLVVAATAAWGAEVRPGVAVRAVIPGEATIWGDWIDGQVQAGALRILRTERVENGGSITRYEQRVDGLPVFGAQLVRRLDRAGGTRAVFGHRFAAAPPSTTPVLSAREAQRVVLDRMPQGAVATEPSLVILPLEDGPALAYMLWGRHPNPPTSTRHFIDARTGAVLLSYEDLKTADVPVVGLGTGVWEDLKKLQTSFDGTEFLAVDGTRPARIRTYDMRYDIESWFFGNDAGFVAKSGDNQWSDGATTDAHAYAGLTYDYYAQRHDHWGIDAQNLPVRSYVHILADYVNAFWDDSTSSMTYGDGGWLGGVLYRPFSGALDVVGHELSHGVTHYSWDGIYQDESGALNEAFSDIMGTGVEFMWEPPGDARKHADYWMGEDLCEGFAPLNCAFRSLANPSLLGDPDHYAVRYLGSEDNGGVHINCGIATHAFFLLVEGGTNRISGKTVVGLGSDRRGDAERIFYRGFTRYLTPAATFSDARAATLQAAEELFGAGSDEMLRTAEAWTAVGVK